MIGTLENNKFIEKKRFYVKSSAGYEQAQGIFYHSKYSLFITTNKLTNGSATILTGNMVADKSILKTSYIIIFAVNFLSIRIYLITADFITVLDSFP